MNVSKAHDDLGKYLLLHPTKAAAAAAGVAAADTLLAAAATAGVSTTPYATVDHLFPSQ
jgi:hypothetical protein